MPAPRTRQRPGRQAGRAHDHELGIRRQRVVGEDPGRDCRERQHEHADRRGGEGAEEASEHVVELRDPGRPDDRAEPRFVVAQDGVRDERGRPAADPWVKQC